MRRSSLILSFTILASISVACGGSSDGPFNEADLRALLSDEEIEAAIPLVIGDKQIVGSKGITAEIPLDLVAGLAGTADAETPADLDPDYIASTESAWALIVNSTEGTASLVLSVTDFESRESAETFLFVSLLGGEDTGNRDTDRAIGHFTAGIQTRNWFGLGFWLCLDGNMGPGPNSFGHPGAGGSIGFADPERRIGFGYVMNQMKVGLADSETTGRRLIDSLYRSL